MSEPGTPTPTPTVLEPGTPAPVITPPEFTIPDQYKEKPWALNIKSHDDMWSQMENAQKVIGADRMPTPKEDWTPEQWGEHYEKLGRPSTPEEYKLDGIELPEGLPADNDGFKEFFKSAHESGLSQKQASEVVKFYMDDLNNANQQAISQAQLEVQECNESLRKEWGDKMQGNVDRSLDMVKQIGEPSLLDAINNSGLGRNPAFIKFLATMSENYGEDNPRSGGKSVVFGGAGHAVQEIAKLKLDSNFMKAYMNRSEPGHDAAVARMLGLQEQLTPDS